SVALAKVDPAEWLLSVTLHSLLTPQYGSSLNYPDPPNRVHSRTYTVLPSIGSPFTVPDRLSPCDCEYRLVLPTPVVPTSNQYSVAPVPALQPKLTVAPARVDPGGGLVIVASVRAAAPRRADSSNCPAALHPGHRHTRTSHPPS